MRMIPLLMACLAMPVHAEVITVSAVGLPHGECREWQACRLSSHHEILIINASNAPETYRYQYQLCMEGICKNAQAWVTVDPHQQWVNAWNGELDVRMPSGKHVWIVRTECGKDKAQNDYTVKVK